MGEFLLTVITVLASLRQNYGGYVAWEELTLFKVE